MSDTDPSDEARILVAVDQRFAHANHLLDVLVKQDEAIPPNVTRLERWGEICYTLKKIGDETIAFFQQAVVWRGEVEPLRGGLRGHAGVAVGEDVGVERLFGVE